MTAPEKPDWSWNRFLLLENGFYFAITGLRTQIVPPPPKVLQFPKSAT